MTSAPRDTVLRHYHYDPLDRLISHALADTPAHQTFYCKSRLTTEIQDAMRYSIMQQGDQLLAQQQSGVDAPDTTLMATDQQRSVLKTVKANQPPQPIAYSPYGHCSAESGLVSLLGFNGERPDPVTRCYLLGNGYRAFNPALMRFDSPDSLSPFSKGGLNAYTYCMGDPINLIDSTGHSAVKWLQRQLGMHPIYLSDHYRPKAIVPTRLAENAYSRIGAIGEQIEKLQEAALISTFLRDRTLAYAVGNPLLSASESAIAIDRARYTPLFESMYAARQSLQHAPFLRNDILHIFEYAARPMKDRELVATYRKRLESVSTPEIDALKTEQARIRKKYFV